jgi:ATP-binding cassette subfamily B (MDR/TAP) protein 1
LRISARLRLQYLEALLRQPVSSIDATSPGTIASKLTSSSNTIESGISQQFSLGIQAIAFTLGLFIVSFVKNPLLTLVAMSVIPMVLIPYALAMPFVNKFWFFSEMCKAGATSLSYEIFESIRIVVAFGAQDRLGYAHNQMLLMAQGIDKKGAPLMGVMLAPMFLAVYLIFALTFWFGMKQYTNHKIDGISTIIVYVTSRNPDLLLTSLVSCSQ